MASNVYSKNEILQTLASKGYIIDAYTLDTFFDKWKIEAIFEDEQGSEFYDKNALDLVLNNMFNTTNQPTEVDDSSENVPMLSSAPKQTQPQPQPMPQQPMQQQPMQQMAQPQMQQMPYQQVPNMMPYQQMPQPMAYQQPQMPYQQMPQPQMQQMPYQQQPVAQQELTYAQQLQMQDNATFKAINNISLSDGTPLMNKIQENPPSASFDDFNQIPEDLQKQIEMPSSSADIDIDALLAQTTVPEEPKEPRRTGILEGAMEASGMTFENDVSTGYDAGQDLMAPDGTEDFDDMSLLSESLEAQERFREYVVSELAKKNVDITSQIQQQQQNEFKLDISERTLNMIARTMAKKIAKYVTTQLSQGGLGGKPSELQEKIKKLETRNKELEETNKKLRALYAETNKNLNSFQPSVFGLYKKVPPEI